ncbi:DUF4214 domain-containing protein [Acidithiobacillus thiooxidans]|jgi:hypothetical protein|uniref:DUF4214 domain-containing protein n=1 Tax=Acidithiobacillus thiooxidans TaxID=930 RepID=UPI0002624DC0|nr:DUF4214 domain-containing protein [Acidithiobacillus thiooxidans]MBU2811778.1 DUF4214 domain-containing protein [Acidithiobacillus thiooxidans]MDD2661752.1 DUF4214 domain-containing protein [Methylococcales bacterium]
MYIKNIEELFVLDGRDFVTEVYRNLLKREPDEQGLRYYLGRMAQGHNKPEIIAQIAKSPECCTLDKIVGLKKLTVDVQRSNSWFWRWFVRHDRMEYVDYGSRGKLAQIEAQFVRTNGLLASLSEAMQNDMDERTQQLDNLVRQVAQMQIVTTGFEKLVDRLQQHLTVIVEMINTRDRADIELKLSNENLETLTYPARYYYRRIYQIISKKGVQ